MKTEWKKVRLGDIATFSNGINFGKESYAKGVKLITVSDFGDRYFPEYNELVEVDEKVLRPTDYLQNGDMVFVRSNGNKELVGRCMLIENPTRPVTYSGFCIRARLNNINENNPRFFTYYFKSRTFRRAMSNTAVGANIQNLNQGLLSNHELLLPDFETQQKIAGILSAYDDLIENNRKQIKLLEEAAQKLYKEWFVKLGFPGHENVKIVDGVPEGWKKVKAEDFFEVTIGKTPPRNEAKWFAKGCVGKKWISIADMGNSGAFIFQTAENLTNEAVESKNVKIVPTNTVLLSFKLTVGRVSITTEEMTTNEAIAHFVTDNKFIREYLYLYLKNFHYDSLGSTSAISTAINSKIVKAMPIIIPSEYLLEKFSSFVAPYFDKIKSLQKQIQLLQSARDKLLPRLMNGDINV